LVAFMAYGQHEIALYEEGTFVPEVGIAELERLLRVPERFSLQRYPLDRQRLRLLTGYLRLFSPSVAEEQVLPLNAVRSLIAFARSLPRYALATDSVGDKGKAVCQVLVTARDPNALLYQSLPEAVGYDALVSDDAMESYLSDLRRVLLTLSDAYRKLLEQVEHDLYDALRAPQDADIGRQLVTERARRLVDSVDDLRLGAFLGRLADAALPQDEWLESVAAVLANRPPAQWSDGDYRRFRVAVWQLAGQLSRLEDIVLSSGADEHASVVRFGITDRYGRELREVLHVTQEDEETVTAATKALLDRLLALGLDSRLEMAALARLAADLMHDTGESTSNG